MSVPLHAEVAFASHGVTCAGWHVRADNDSLVNHAGRPCVVMAHGFGGTRDSGLLAYAEPFARAGIDAFVFDYRGFGRSAGSPRQDVAYKKQREDYHSAIDAVRRLPSIDPSRIALWGTSYSAGHVVAVAAQRSSRGDGVAGVVSLTPAVDGFAALSNIARYAGLGQLAWATAQAFRDKAGAVLGRAPLYVPIVGSPGSRAMMTTDGAAEAFAAMAGPTARNEVCARTALEAARNRPIIYARKVVCPVLIQIGTRDQVAPPSVARRMAQKMHDAEVLSYPFDHFDVYDDPGRASVLADQLEFLTELFA